MSKLISKKKVSERFDNISDDTVDRWVKEGILPRPIRVGPRRVLWEEDAIEAVVAAMTAERDKTKPPATEAAE